MHDFSELRDDELKIEIKEQVEIEFREALETLQKEEKDLAKVAEIFDKFIHIKIKDMQEYFVNSVVKHREYSDKELLSLLKGYRELDKDAKPHLEQVCKEDLFKGVASFMTQLGVYNLSNKFHALSVEELVRDVADKVRNEVGGLAFKQKSAKLSGSKGGAKKAEKERKIVFYVLDEYQKKYLNSDKSMKNIADLIKVKVNELIETTPELRAYLRPYTEESEAIFKWISNLKYFIENGKFRGKTSHAVKVFGKKHLIHS